MSKRAAIFVVVTLLLAVGANIARAAGEPQQQSALADRVMKSRTAEHITATWRCQDKIPVARTRAHSPWKPHSQAFRRWQLNLWTQRHQACSAFLKERARQWNWQAFPEWIIRLARCESSINWFAEGSSSDGVFYSAFNISRSQYDKDAHYMGVRGWHEGPGVPSPYEQAMAVIGHMRLLGDGFTGRCHGIARSSWS